MAQADFGTIDPNTTSGTELANVLTLMQTALETNHSGASRPSYVKVGMIWLDNASSTSNYLKMWTGSVDIILFTINMVSGVITAGGSGGGGVDLSGYVPTSRVINANWSLSGSGNLGADLTLTLANDVVTPGNNAVYGTNGSGVRGWRSFPTPPAQARSLGIFGPGSYTVTVPALVSSAWVTLIAGGGPGYSGSGVDYAGLWGACACGAVPVTPGETLTMDVGGAGGSTSFHRGSTGLVYCGGGGGGVTLASGIDVATTAPTLREAGGTMFGAPGVGSGNPGQTGIATVEFIQ